MVIYFSGTGNSKYIAGVISDRLGDSVSSAAELIKKWEAPEFYSDKPYIFVAPIYAWQFPKVFREWIEKCRFLGNKKAYFVITCGSDIGAAANHIKRFAEKYGFGYMGTAPVVMPDNYLIMFSPQSAEKDNEVIEKAEKSALTLCERIENGEAFSPLKNTFVGHICSDVVNPFFYLFYIGADKFYVTDACVSCGKCAEVCMLNNIKIVDGKPKWGKDCTHCVACISNCPALAIEYGKNTKGRRRYTCPKEK